MNRTPAWILLLSLAVLPAAAAPAPSAQLIVDQEAKFQQAVVEQGTRAGFLSLLAESAVALTPAPVPARAFYEEQPASPSRLRWRPELAAIAAGGDFGWASGPWLLFKSATGEQPDASGSYLTVWRRRADHWEVWLDGGISYGMASAERARHLDVKARLRPVATQRATDQDCEQAFVALWKSKGRAAALKEYAADDLRLLQFGQPPLDGHAAVAAGDSLRTARLEALRPARRASAAAGDLEVTYGQYQIAPEADRARRALVYVEVWDKAKRCRLALEFTAPISQ
jgi:ketosteroid isomerase-like protein